MADSFAVLVVTEFSAFKTLLARAVATVGFLRGRIGRLDLALDKAQPQACA